MIYIFFACLKQHVKYRIINTFMPVIPELTDL